MAYQLRGTYFESCMRSRIQAFGLDRDNTGKNAHSAPFAWQA